MNSPLLSRSAERHPSRCGHWASGSGSRSTRSSRRSSTNSIVAGSGRIKPRYLSTCLPDCPTTRLEWSCWRLASPISEPGTRAPRDRPGVVRSRTGVPQPGPERDVGRASCRQAHDQSSHRPRGTTDTKCEAGPRPEGPDPATGAAAKLGARRPGASGSGDASCTGTEWRTTGRRCPPGYARWSASRWSGRRG
jgi:hypothetical protein